MQHWIVTHNPHLIPDPHGWHIFARTKSERRPLAGDPVLFYECETPFAGRDRLGAKALVCASTVAGRDFEELPEAIGLWKFTIRCAEPAKFGTPVPYQKVRQIAPWFVRPGGCKRLTAEEYQALFDALNAAD